MARFDTSKLKVLRKIDGFFKAIYFFPKNKKQYPKLQPQAVKEIVVIGFMMIGDTIMSIPSLGVLKKNFPDTRITLVGGKHVEILLKEQGLIDDFVTVKVPWLTRDNSLRNIFNFFSSLRIVNRKKYDLAIDFRGDWRNIFYMNFIRSARKVSFNYTGGEYMLTDVVEPNALIEHYIEEWLFLLSRVGCTYTDEDKLPVLHLSPADIAFVNNFKAANNLHGRFVIGIHPGASQEVKKWDEGNYGELIIKLARAYTDATFIIFEGPNERETVVKLQDILTANQVSFMPVNTGLHEYSLLISLCNLIVCNDSGAAHIAGAFKVPTVVIFGNVDPKFVTPYGAEIKKIISHTMECKPCHQSYCKFGHNLCIKSISVDEVHTPAADIINSLKLA
jgi:lipopolysaccharide heptosyltransferase II